MYEWLLWLESSSLGEALRGANVWTYGLLNLAHILGIASLFGSILVLDLRMMGCWPRLSLSALSAAIVPLAAAAFTLAVISGVAMLSVNATEYHGNPFMFYIKFPALLVAIVNILLLSRVSAWRQRHVAEPDSRGRRLLALSAAVSLLSWLVVIIGGRMVGYW